MSCKHFHSTMASSTKDAAKSRGKTWCDDATRTLINLWSEETVQLSLENRKSSKEKRQVYNRLLIIWIVFFFIFVKSFQSVKVEGKIQVAVLGLSALHKQNWMPYITLHDVLPVWTETLLTRRKAGAESRGAVLILAVPNLFFWNRSASCGPKTSVRVPKFTRTVPKISVV